MKNGKTTPTGALIRLGRNDNVLIAPGPVGVGLAQIAGGGELQVVTPVTLGHKLAARDISAGEKITKYNVPIGSATEDIPAGSHVHVHNMKSDYTATYILDQTAKGGVDA